MKIPNRDAAERISFNTKVRLQIFVCGITEHNSSTDCQQNWAMKNSQEPHANRKANQNATPDLPAAPAL